MGSFPQTDVAANAVVRNSMPTPGSAGQLGRLQCDPQGNLLFARGMPGKSGLVRLGYSFYKQGDYGLTNPTALPGTTAAAAFTNLNQARSVIIDKISFHGSVVADTAGCWDLIANITQTALTSQPATADTAVIVASLNCACVNAGTMSKVTSSHAVTIVNNGWWSIGNTGYDATTGNETRCFCASIDGLIILPPGHQIGLSCLATDATGSGGFGMLWHEMVL